MIIQTAARVKFLFNVACVTIAASLLLPACNESPTTVDQSAGKEKRHGQILTLDGPTSGQLDSVRLLHNGFLSNCYSNLSPTVDGMTSTQLSNWAQSRGIAYELSTMGTAYFDTLGTGNLDLFARTYQSDSVYIDTLSGLTLNAESTLHYLHQSFYNTSLTGTQLISICDSIKSYALGLQSAADAWAIGSCASVGKASFNYWNTYASDWDTYFGNSIINRNKGTTHNRIMRTKINLKSTAWADAAGAIGGFGFAGAHGAFAGAVLFSGWASACDALRQATLGF